MFLVTGANGQLGTALQCLLKDQAVYIDREDLDLADEAAVKAYFAAHKFDFVINCAAYTAVDRAEGDAENAHKVNALAPLYLAKYGRNVVHISTDYVLMAPAASRITKTTQPTRKASTAKPNARAN